VFSGVRADLTRYLDAGFTSLFNFPRYYALHDGFALAGSVDIVARAVADDLATYGLEKTLDLVTFVDNHDVPRFVNGPGAGVSEAEIGRRYRLALATLFTAPGIPQLYAGDELGMYGGADPDNRRDMPAWAWDGATRAGVHPGQALPDAQATFAYVQRLIALRRELSALATGSYAELWRQNGAANPNVWAFFRGAGSSRALVVMNAGATATELHLPIAASHMLSEPDKLALGDGTRLTDRLAAGAPPSATVAAGMLTLALPAGAVAIYVP
jgi:alpha-amylase